MLSFIGFLLQFLVIGGVVVKILDRIFGEDEPKNNNSQKADTLNEAIQKELIEISKDPNFNQEDWEKLLARMQGTSGLVAKKYEINNNKNKDKPAQSTPKQTQSIENSKSNNTQNTQSKDISNIDLAFVSISRPAPKKNSKCKQRTRVHHPKRH